MSDDDDGDETPDDAPQPGDGEPAPHRVGYGSPPLHTRFTKGVSGNIHGRPKGARGYRTVLRTALETKINVQERDGRTRRKRAIEIIVQRDVGKALKGEDKALARVQAQARALDLEDEAKAAGRRSHKLSPEDEAILAYYAPKFFAPPDEPPADSPPEPGQPKEKPDEDPS